MAEKYAHRPLQVLKPIGASASKPGSALRRPRAHTAQGQQHDASQAACCTHHPAAPLSALTDAQRDGDWQHTPIRIMQMDCPTEEALLRKKLGGLAQVKALEFNLMQRVMTVTHRHDALDEVLAAVRAVGFEPEIHPPQGAQSMPPAEKKAWWPLALAIAVAALAEVADWMQWPVWSAAGLAIIAVALSGLGTYRKGWIALRTGNLNINALMSIAVTGALILQQWPEAAMVMVLFTLAERIEARSLDRARNAIAGLMNLAPQSATVQQPDGRWQEAEASQILPGSIVRVRPGERIALDGDIISGQSAVNQAPITGESLPVDKGVGDRVFAGTINENGAFEYRVTAAASDTTLARIIHAVEQAQGAKAPTQRFVDQFARVYTPLVFAAALLVATLPPLFGAGEWLAWIYKALVLLVIACPCALVISTPVTIVSGLAAAARRGILIKGGVFLEKGHALRWLALDKTGTLTQGKPVQTGFYALNETEDARCRQLAASLAARSDHPVSRAIAEAATDAATPLLEVATFSAVAGQGVIGTLENQRYFLGNLRLAREWLGAETADAFTDRLAALEQAGNTTLVLGNTQQVLALIAVADSVKPSSQQAITALHQLGIRTLMLTGDNTTVANAIAQQVGVDEAHGNLLPQDKLAHVERLCAQGMVGMVGDGINDTPALARADIGFAMGAMGTGSAIETADVALMNDDLRKIPEFVRISTATRAILIQNIALALGIKALFLALTLLGMGTMWMAVFADVGASLLVVGNGLRLLRQPAANGWQ
ncbi:MULTISPECIES: heavy metal translocating P-type ATPase [Dickeya]|uniref:P-type Zn(2+) transporter n=1 Tax=Dickeya aquatica TaxID=1401087 RepID=A0A375A6F0_9GAMM|nr:MULTISPECIES: heavy metal translocating P-type ATPase [Dickeya]SLM61672.1 Lead, cadmium, zinc and mercury transporting ATPase; Copper-translocating P-type ATPase [Dickeya aquatica]